MCMGGSFVHFSSEAFFHYLFHLACVPLSFSSLSYLFVLRRTCVKVKVCSCM